MTNFPDDEDGAVLADLAEHGVDLSQPLLIEFAIDAPDEDAAHAIGKALTGAGYEFEIEHDEGELEDDDEDEIDADIEGLGPSWTVYAKVDMIPEYKEIIRIQVDLTRLADPHGGNCDGWGVMLED